MNLYKITMDKSFVSYDTFDSAVVAANSKDEAREIRDLQGEEGMYLFWVQPLEGLSVELIGVADKSIKKPVAIVASFNAG